MEGGESARRTPRGGWGRGTQAPAGEGEASPWGGRRATGSRPGGRRHDGGRLTEGIEEGVSRVHDLGSWAAGLGCGTRAEHASLGLGEPPKLRAERRRDSAEAPREQRDRLAELVVLGRDDPGGGVHGEVGHS